MVCDSGFHWTLNGPFGSHSKETGSLKAGVRIFILTLVTHCFIVVMLAILSLQSFMLVSVIIQLGPLQTTMLVMSPLNTGHHNEVA